MHRSLHRSYAVAALSAYFLYRLWAIPADVAVTGAFSHDSSYLSIVAHNIASGQGFVNQAHLLLFLQPEHLPMPYHNANPLYPALSAFVSQLSGWDAAKSGAIVSLCGHIVLAIATYFLVTAFVARPLTGWLAAAGVMFFPANFRESFAVLPDALATGLGLSVCAVVVRARHPAHWAGAGVLFGLAWLTRSTALLALPAVGVFAICRHGWRNPLRPTRWLALFGVTVLVTISPWLIHTAGAWGTPFRSDSTFYWLQEYYAHRNNIEINQYWRSLTKPPSVAQVLSQDPSGLASRAIQGIPHAAWHWLAQLADWSKTWLAAFAFSVVLGAWWLRHSYRGRWPELLAAMLLAALTFFSLTVRAETLEARYLGLSNVLLALLAFAACHARPRWLATPAFVFWLLLVPQHNWLAAGQLRAERPDLVVYRQGARALAQSHPAGPVVTPLPYLYTYYTGQPAISPPYPGKSELLTIMRKYGAGVVWAPPNPEYSLQYLYPGAPASLSPEFSTVSSAGVTFMQLQSTP